MTAPAAEQPDAIAVAPVRAGSGKLLGFVAIALVAGAAVGTLVVAPRLRGGSAAPVPHVAKEAKPAGPRRVIRLDNLIVNPQGTRGDHFLIVSVGIEVESPLVETRLHEAEVPLRDAITELLGKMSMDQLGQVGARDLVRRQIAAASIKFAGDSALQIYLPQFLVQ